MLVLLHGFGAGKAVYLNQLQQLGQWFTVYSLDWLGSVTAPSYSTAVRFVYRYLMLAASCYQGGCVASAHLLSPQRAGHGGVVRAVHRAMAQGATH